MGLVSRKTCWPLCTELSTLALPKTSPAQGGCSHGRLRLLSRSHRAQAGKMQCWLEIGRAFPLYDSQWLAQMRAKVQLKSNMGSWVTHW